jgi:hypothetical protein
MRIVGGGVLATAVAVAGLLLGLLAVSAAPVAQEPTPAGTPTPAECQPQALIEAPTAEQPLRGVVTVGGWAIDLASPAGTGVTDVHVYLDGYGGESGHTFIGRAQYGAARVDVATQFNDVRFARSAFNLSWDASTAGAGSHTLVVLYRTRCGWASLTENVDVDGPTTLLNIEAPPQGSLVAAPVRLQGWAADPQAPSGTGVDRVELYLDGEVTTLGVPLGDVPYGESRPDVGAALGGENELARARFSRSGFGMFWNPSGLSPGSHSLTVYARGADGAVARSLAVEIAPGTPGPRVSPTVGSFGTALRPTEGLFTVNLGTTSPTSVALSWTPVPGAGSYDVFAAEGVGAFFPVQTALTEGRTVATGLASGRSYRFFVRAYDLGGNEVGRSNTVSVTTGTALTTATPALTQALPSTPRPSPTMPNQF